MTHSRVMPRSTKFTTHALLLTAIFLFANANESLAKVITTKTAKQLIENDKIDIILDVRTPQEFKSGHIKGAQLIPINLLSARLGEIAKFKNKTVLVYCAVGGRSGKASRLLRSSGFNHILDMKGGMIDWTKQGYPTVK